MKKNIAIVVLFALLGLAACNSSTKQHDTTAQKVNAAGRQSVQQENKELAPPVITNFLDYHNYINAQKVYDDPSTIQWCTTTWGNASAPLVTIPIAGKLTSSTVSLFPSSQVVDIGSDSNQSSFYPELPSVDAMYHGSPPPYRYGFTPGGQYVDFFNMAVICTTALTSFQRQSTTVAITTDAAAQVAQNEAEAALKKCQVGNTKTKTVSTSCPAAQAALQKIAGGK